MKQKTHISYWFLAVVIILLVALAACTRPAPQPEQLDVTEVPVTQPTQEQLATPVPATPTPLTEEPYPGDGLGETPPPVDESTDPNAGGEVVVTEPTAPEQGTTHLVQAGENLAGISQLYGVSQEEIAIANNITVSSELVAGQTLVIPVPGTVVTSPEVQPPDQSGAGEQVHIVQPGENLFRISLRYGKSVDEVAAYNGIANPHYIYPGQEIRIP